MPKIKTGIKPCTIRAPRGFRDRAQWKDRHAHVGEPITLLTGPRMKPTALGKSICLKRASITIAWHPQIEIIEAGEKVPLEQFDHFAIEDGFDDMEDMARF